MDFTYSWPGHIPPIQSRAPSHYPARFISPCSRFTHRHYWNRLQQPLLGNCRRQFLPSIASTYIDEIGILTRMVSLTDCSRSYTPLHYLRLSHRNAHDAPRQGPSCRLRRNCRLLLRNRSQLLLFTFLSYDRRHGTVSCLRIPFFTHDCHTRRHDQVRTEACRREQRDWDGVLDEFDWRECNCALGLSEW